MGPTVIRRPSPTAAATPVANRVTILLALIFLLTQLSTGSSSAVDTTVTSITPQWGGLNGGQRITIYGAGFADDQFSFGSGRNHLGNEVQLVSNSRAFPCEIHQDGCTEKQIMCYTSTMPQDDYFVRVWIDGQRVPDSNLCNGKPNSSKCRLRARYNNSPIIEEVSPQSGPPGTLVTISGRIFTTLYGTNQETSPNGKSARISRKWYRDQIGCGGVNINEGYDNFETGQFVSTFRTYFVVYMGGQVCSLLNPEDNQLYGMELENENSDWGFLRCRINGTYVGNANASFLVNGEYGRSFSNLETLRVTVQNKLAMFQTFAEISSVGPVEGSTEGGTRLTIAGQGFDETDAPARVLVGGGVCDVVSVTYNEIICITAPPQETYTTPEQNSTGAFPGGRGILLETWNVSNTHSLTWEEISNFTAPHEYEWVDHASWYVDTEPQRTVRRIRGFFTIPGDGVYRFAAKSDDDGILFASLTGDPADKMEVASVSGAQNSYWNKPSQISQPFTLNKGHQVYLELMVKNHFGRGYGDIAVHKANTPYLASQSKFVHQEKQEVVIDSQQLPETQLLNFTQWGGQDVVQEVQTVDVESSMLGGVVFRLGMDGVFTGAMGGEVSADDVRKEVNFLPSVASDSVRVSKEALVGGNRYTITFVSQRGDWSDLEAMNDPSSPVNATFSVAEVTKGRSNRKVFLLSLDGHPSPPISALPSVTQLEEGLADMFSVRCPSYVGQTYGKAYYQDYESNNGYSESGTRVSDMEPFCGRTSSRNPGFIYQLAKQSPKVDPKTKNQLCFAYQGSLKPRLYLAYDYQIQGSDQWNNAYDTFEPVDFPNNNRWNHICVDMAALILGKRPEVKSSKLQKVQVFKESDDLYIDSVFIGSRTPTEDFVGLAEFGRLVPPHWTVSSVKVEGDSSTGFKLEFHTFDCANDMPLLAIHNMPPSSTSSEETTYSDDVSISITRLQAGTPPIGGTFDVRFGTTTIEDIPVDIDIAELGVFLETAPDLGFVDVQRTGNCGRYTWTIDWQDTPGDQPQLEILNSSSLTGPNVTTEVLTKQNGGLWFDPLAGDFLRTVEDMPQVHVVINNIPSRCSGNCSFQWTQSSTPTVTGVTPTSGSPGTSLTISGTDFATDTSLLNVTIGGVGCLVTSSSTTEVQCDVGPGPAGAQRVQVQVLATGFAQHIGGDHEFSYIMAVTDFSPAGGSLEGGTILNITGTGFASNTTVSIGTSPCEIFRSTYDTIFCVTPAMAEGSYAVLVEQDGSNASAGSQFSYQGALTPVITALSGSSGLVQGGQVLTITGTGFGSQIGDSEVKVAETTAEISAYNDTSIELVLPPAGPGSYPLSVYVEGKGFADISTNGIPEIRYTLTVQNVSPDQGSLVGGTRITVVGEGFSPNYQDNTVLMGTTSCRVTDSNSTLLLCDLQAPSKTVTVTNQGSHPDFGPGYAWTPRVVELPVGGSVSWQWEAVNGVSDAGYLVQQLPYASASVYNGTGFSSGSTKTPTGVFTHQFTSPGTYHYWSGKVDRSGKIILRGAVIVKEWQALTVPVSVHVSGFEADYNTNSGVGTTGSEGCVGTTSSISGCVESAPSGQSASNFSFTFTNCSTPVVTSFSPTQGSSSDVITFTGWGFSDTCCQNEIFIGGTTCIVDACTENELACQVAPDNDLEIGVMHPVHILVNNRGMALLDIENEQDGGFVLLPSVTGVAPNTGSLQGGTKLTISGNGFNNDPSAISVIIGGVPCKVASTNNSEIICLTGPGQELTANVSVALIKYGQAIPATCFGSCEFSFAALSSPTITNIEPTSINNTNQVVSITGNKFGTDLSGVHIKFGDTSCSINSIADNSIECLLEAPLVGNQPVTLDVSPLGLADSAANLVVTVQALLSGVYPNEGSIHGGQLLTVEGIGFKPDATTVNLGDNECMIQTINTTLLTCITPAGSASTVEIRVTSDGVDYPTSNYDYTVAQTPAVTSVSPSSGIPGESITLSGSGFGTIMADADVTIDGATCLVTVIDDASITCTLGNQAAGIYDILVKIAGKGFANNDVGFTYDLSLASITPSQGSFGGGQIVTITGRGLDDTANVTVCGNPCLAQVGTTSTQLICSTPKHEGSGSQTCDVIVVVGASSGSLASAYTYNDAVTAHVTSVTPRRGGTGGGTSLTISGSGFGSDVGQVSVDIAGTDCPVSSVTDAQIVCITDQHKPSVQTQVRVHVASNGIAFQDSAEFEYIDVWSSLFTWNGILPMAGDMVVIPEDMTVLLDTDTPVLKLLLINGGKLIFEDKNVELQAEIILITDGGVLQVGTEAEPFQNKAIITLHGHQRSKELPIYGTKVIAVRGGTLDLHGKHVGYTWTRLGSTANAGASQITLEVSVSWQIGDEIVIATTGHRHSQRENEQRTITAVSSDGLTLTLDSPLTYKHLGQTVSLDDAHSFEARAEVGLLTHNVVIRGSEHPEWTDKIEACPEGFNTGEFAVQTCFQGRFGEEMGWDQFGAQLIMHAPRANEGLVTARIENVEFKHVGQAFRLGRYPIHFHLLGDMAGAYVRSSSVHRSFNRALVVHGTHNVMVDNNVVYDIMGGAVFLEDGIETGNTLQYNLAVFVKQSTSLQNDDITPAAFWVTNPNNTVQHNTAAGGTHFGFWYRMHDHPDGPSFDENICPKKVPLGVFYNNTVHSQGWFGLWIFQDFYPMQGGHCDSNVPEAARFYNLTAWNCEKGAEWVGGGALQYIGFQMINNDVAGIDMKLIAKAPEYSENGAIISDGIIANRPEVSTILDTQHPSTGIIMPYSRGLIVRNMKFFNFDTGAAFGVTTITGTTESKNGGFKYHVSGLEFINSPKRVAFRWEHEAVYCDLDGSLSGVVGGRVVPTMAILPPSCESNEGASAGVAGSVCPNNVDFHRWSFNHYTPSSLLGRRLSVTNSYGTSFGEYKKKRVTHKKGWMVLLPSGGPYSSNFVNAEHLTNISYSGRMDDFTASTHLVWALNVTQRPDMVTIYSGQPQTNESTDAILTGEGSHGDWYYDNSTTTVYILLKGEDSSRKKRSVNSVTHLNLSLRVYRCFYMDCLPPPPPPSGNQTFSGLGRRPADYKLWSVTDTWASAEPGWGGNYGDGTYGPPEDGKDVMIRAGDWVVVDARLPIINKLYIYGVLELEYQIDPETGTYHNFILNCSHILIAGGRLIVGWEDEPFLGQASIVLRGDHYTPDMPLPDGPNLGAKALGVFGSLDLHGENRSVTWTRLTRTADVGDTSITLEEAVDWVPGDSIVVAPTSYSPWEGEIFKIISVSDDNTTLTLNGSMKYKHIAAVETINQTGQIISMAAEVGLLTRNIKIVGAEYPDLLKQAFGARVLVGQYVQEGITYTGSARISNVEFYHTGQEGWTDYYDPRYSLAFLDIGEVSDEKPSYVKKCAFHHGFSPAIGIFNADHLDVENNVIYHTVGSAIISYSMDTRLRRNLVTLVVSPGSFNGRKDLKLVWDAGIELNQATSPVLHDNVIAGSERSGFHIDGQSCTATDRWSGNVAHSLLIGVMSLPGDGITTCSRFVGFTVYKAFDFGLFLEISTTNQMETIEITGIVSVDNSVGLFPFVYAPSATGHMRADKLVALSDSTFIGTSDSYDCAADGNSLDQSTFSFASSVNSRSWRVYGSGRTGITIPTFSSGSNNAPTKPFKNIMAYQAIGGLFTASNITFSKFRSACGSRDVCLTPNPGNDDGIHPTRMSNIRLVDVDTDSKVFFHRANLGKVNPADCVDMECDGLKKVIVDDMDGTFLGKKGSIISQSEFEWNGDTKRGLGDYRIPKQMLTALDGSRIAVNDIAPHQGIIRNENCTYVSPFQAWECHGYDYEMLMLESMDSDTETRRVSPIAVLGDGYVDLVNGPQDHGWCSGYTCQKRLSTFPLVLAMGVHFEVFFTGTTPQNMRLHLLNSNTDQAVVLAIWYASPYRLDVYHANTYLPPTNSYKDANGQQLLSPPLYAGHFIPNVTTDPTGTNYVERSTSVLHVLVRGDTPVEIKTSPLLVIAFNVPAMTVDEFFGEKIVQNLALFLDIPASKIRIASSTRETRRKKREADTVSVSVEIGNDPGESAGSDSSFMSYDVMQSSAATLTNAVQLDTLATALDTPISGVSIIEPMPATDDPAWQIVTDTLDSGESYVVVVQVPSVLSVKTQPVPLQEGSLFSIQPVLQALDQQGNMVGQLGSKVNPWQVSAELVLVSGSDTRAILDGNTTVQFRNGYANFEDLKISHSGRYKIVFNVTHPAEAAGKFIVTSREFEVAERQLAGNIANQPSVVAIDEPFTMEAVIVDVLTGGSVEDLAWKGHNWTCWTSIFMPEISPPAILNGTASAAVDLSTGDAVFTDLVLDLAGRYFLELRCRSSPPEFSVLAMSQAIDVVPKNFQPPVEDSKKRATIRFDVDFDVVVAGKEAYFAAFVYNLLQPQYNATLKNFNVSRGSILVSFDVAGSARNVEETLVGLVARVRGMSLTFNGYTAVTDGYIMVDGDQLGDGFQVAPGGLSTGVIVAISVSCVVTVLAILIIGIAWAVKTKKAKSLKIGLNDQIFQPSPRRQRMKSNHEMALEGSDEVIIPKAPPRSVLYPAPSPSSSRPATGRMRSPSPLQQLPVPASFLFPPVSPSLPSSSGSHSPSAMPLHLSVGSLASSGSGSIRGRSSPRVAPISEA